MIKLVVLLAALSLVAVACGDEGSSSVQGGEPNVPAEVPFDRAFIDAMVPHHREAIAMAEAASERRLSQPDLVQIANDIIDSQKFEIDQMLEWREEWFGSRALGPVEPEVLGVPEDRLGMEHGTADQVTNAADGDATFAALMIPHHEGAIAMAEAATRRAQHDELRDLAARIIDAQEREIEVMEPHASDEHHG
ncbi:MAG: DUF305 domain-containing protein [Actinobacteria bacterium]|nr:DUF305 domain-containing protein [Actinomycetota bacterium]